MVWCDLTRHPGDDSGGGYDDLIIVLQIMFRFFAILKPLRGLDTKTFLRHNIISAYFRGNLFAFCGNFLLCNKQNGPHKS